MFSIYIHSLCLLVRVSLSSIGLLKLELGTKKLHVSTYILHALYGSMYRK